MYRQLSELEQRSWCAKQSLAKTDSEAGKGKTRKRKNGNGKAEKRVKGGKKGKRRKKG